MEIIINETRIKYEDGKIWKFGKRMNTSKQETWYVLKGNIQTNQTGYKLHRTYINGKKYNTSRVIYKIHNPKWDIDDCNINNTIDHINRDSLDNRIENLRIATMLEQVLNTSHVINQKGYSWIKRDKKWYAYISIDGKIKNLGLFVLEEDARKARLDGILKYHK